MTYYEIIAKYHNIWQSSLDSSLVSAMNLLKLWLVVVEGWGLGASPLRRTDTLWTGVNELNHSLESPRPSQP